MATVEVFVGFFMAAAWPQALKITDARRIMVKRSECLRIKLANIIYSTGFLGIKKLMRLNGGFTL
jgi:hypothetical protein